MKEHRGHDDAGSRARALDRGGGDDDPTSAAPGADGTEWSKRKTDRRRHRRWRRGEPGGRHRLSDIREQRAGAFNDNHCGVTGSLFTGPADCSSRYDGVQNAEKIAIVGFIGAAVLGGVGTFLFLSGGNGSSEGATASASSDLHCVPSAGWGVACAARF